MAEGRLSHAYMLVGPEGPARTEAAARLTAALLCSESGAPCGRCRDCRKVLAGVHPDVAHIARLPDDRGRLRREIVVEQIRRATADAVVAPNEAARKAYVIDEADRMNAAAQNALLKALEDPPGHACFILCTTAADALLPTVRSRCVRTDDTPRAEALPPLSDAARAFLELIPSGNRADIVMFCMLRASLGREEADALLEELAGALCDMLCARRDRVGLSDGRILELSALIDRARDYLRHNVSPKQVFGAMAAEL